MKSSKIENIFNLDPPLEEPKNISPLTYYQPFQSTFDPEFVGPPAKGGCRLNPSRWSPGAPGNLHRSAGPRERDLRLSPPGPSPSLLGETERRSLCNSTWRTSPPLAPPQFCPARSPTTSHFRPKPEPLFRGSACSSFRQGGPFAQLPPYEGGLAPPHSQPFTLSPLGKNVHQSLHKSGHPRPMVCNFCKNNKEVPDIYMNHYLYDPETKVLSCPVLRKHVCEICGGTGDQAHTLQYCPVNRERGLQAKVPVLLKTRTITNSTGKIRRN